ncbi:MAG: TIGR02147 family protein [Fibrobacterota bacterium]|nr:TIGR02147 family protein [Fibrobacterota bacterium]QQS07220.1 MAG: TIGR02147 family protein [Fibrobacterota bacterium]
MTDRPNVFTYFDARRFLREAQKAIKVRKRNFTLEHLGELVGLKSKGHVSLVLQGSKNIPEEKIALFAQAFELEGREAVFFGHLVRFTQALTHRDRKMHLDRMVSCMRVADRKLVPSQYALCSAWYHPVVHELLRMMELTDDWESLASSLRPRISADQARDSVALLEEIGLVSRDVQGVWRPTDVVVTFGEGWRSVAVREFQRHAINLAQGALEEVPATERDVSHLTLSIGEESFRELKERLALFRKEALTLARQERNPDRVCMLNLSLFPVGGKR